MISIKNVFKTYHSKKGTDTEAIKNINLELPSKGLVFLTGKSGSGKSTLLNILGGLDTFDTGSIKIQESEMKHWSSKEYDNYRNSFVGFIFQEFNLLENLSVYENIALPQELQQKPVTQKEIDALLQKLDLENLGNRKVFELSGGQKGRVAIARALIKNPEIILADEPTGNLDEASSTQIFEILKEISKETLVLIVTHDKEAATIYGDRILKIQDGQITEDTGKIGTTEKEKKPWNPSKLPNKYAWKLTCKNLSSKPFKLVMSIILLAFSLTFIGLTMNIFFYNERNTTSKIVKNNNIQNYQLEIIEKNKEQTTTKELEEKDLQELENFTNSTVHPIYQITTNGSPLKLEINFNFPSTEEEHHKFFYYSNHPNIEQFVEIQNEEIFANNLIGRAPKNDKEMVIHKYLAETILYYGIKDTFEEIYKPNTIEELVSDYHPIKLGENTIYITGVINDDNSPFLESLTKGRWYPRLIQDFFDKDYKRKASTVYVRGLTQIIQGNTENREILNHLRLENKNTSQLLENTMLTLQKEIQIVTEEGSIQKNDLTKEEIIIPISTLKNLDDYFKTNYNTFLSTEEESLENITNFLQNYLKEKPLKQWKINLLHETDHERNELASLVVVGISLDNHTYISKDYLSLFETLKKECTSVYVHELDFKKIQNAINKSYVTIPTNESGSFPHFMINFNEDIMNTTAAYQNSKLFVTFLCTVFILFAFILCLHVISNSIMTNKKEIGILRALGTQEKDVTKIFQLETGTITVLSWLLASLSYIFICIWLNQKEYSLMYYKKDALTIYPIIPIILLLLTFILSFLITYFVTRNITKIKPVDAIHNK